MKLQILRLGKVREGPQLGVLKLALLKRDPQMSDILCLTLERPWVNNLKSISCIPPGNYKCKRVFNRVTGGGTHLPVTFEVLDVPNRSGILFHPGNSLADTEGCILLGQKLRSPTEIGESVIAFNAFIHRITDSDIPLEVLYV